MALTRFALYTTVFFQKCTTVRGAVTAYRRLRRQSWGFAPHSLRSTRQPLPPKVQPLPSNVPKNPQSGPKRASAMALHFFCKIAMALRHSVRAIVL